MTWLLAGLLLGVIAAGWYGFDRQRAVYEQLVGILAADRDAARNEAKVFRALLFPASKALDVPPESKPISAPLINTRQPFRLRFKQSVRANATGQLKKDNLAAALLKQGYAEKPETTNA